MSVVIGIVDNECVVMASDSQITISGVKKTSKLKSNYKIWHPNEKKDILIGTAGDVREMNIAKYVDDLIDELKYLKNEIDMKYISKDLIKKLLTALKEANVISSKDNVLAMNNNYLVANQNKLYQISPNGAVIEIDKYTAIGSGGNEALASLKNSVGRSTIERIKLAMDASSNNDIYVDYPLIISKTNTLDFSVIGGVGHIKTKE